MENGEKDKKFDISEYSDYFEERNDYIKDLIGLLEKRHKIKTEFNKKVIVDGSEQVANVHYTGLFPSGVIVSTRAVNDWIMNKSSENVEFMKNKRLFVQLCLIRHFGGDWGILPIEDEIENENSINPNKPFRVMSVYKYPFKKGDVDADFYDYDGDLTIWIITEWDRAVTTVLFPSDY